MGQGEPPQGVLLYRRLIFEVFKGCHVTLKGLSFINYYYLWDEPLNYLDVFNREQIIKLLETSHPTMLLVEHDQDFIERISNQIINLKDT